MMCNQKRTIICIVTVLFLFIAMSTGCSTTVVNSSNKPADILKGNKAKETSPSLETWVGDYTFSESAPPDQNMFYEISIYKENDNYYAKINIDGFQTTERLLAKVSGDENSIKLTFYKYLPDNLFEPYSEGETLLRFEKRNSQLYTYWNKIVPMLESNTKSGEIYFKPKS